jgi:hypothetical protein
MERTLLKLDAHHWSIYKRESCSKFQILRSQFLSEFSGLSFGLFQCLRVDRIALFRRFTVFHVAGDIHEEAKNSGRCLAGGP